MPRTDAISGQCAIPICWNGYQRRPFNKDTPFYHNDKPSYFVFPHKVRYPDLRQEWINNVKLAQLQSHDIGSGTKICNLHFSEECFRKTRGLLRTAVPTLFYVNVAWAVPGCPFITDKCVNLVKTSGVIQGIPADKGEVFQPLDIHMVSDNGRYESVTDFASDISDPEENETGPVSCLHSDPCWISACDHAYSTVETSDSVPCEKCAKQTTVLASESGELDDLSSQDTSHLGVDHGYGKDPSLWIPEKKQARKTRKKTERSGYSAFLCGACNRVFANLQGLDHHIVQSIAKRGEHLKLGKKSSKKFTARNICGAQIYFIPYCCSVCSAIFESERSFKSHTNNPQSTCHWAVCKPSRPCDWCKPRGRVDVMPKDFRRNRYLPLPTGFQKKKKQTVRTSGAQKELYCYFCNEKLPYVGKVVHICAPIVVKCRNQKLTKSPCMPSILTRQRAEDATIYPTTLYSHTSKETCEQTDTHPQDYHSVSDTCSNRLFCPGEVKNPPLVRRELFGDRGSVYTEPNLSLRHPRDKHVSPCIIDIHPVDRLECSSFNVITLSPEITEDQQDPVEGMTMFQMETSSDEDDSPENTAVKIEPSSPQRHIPDLEDLLETYVIMTSEQVHVAQQKTEPGDTSGDRSAQIDPQDSTTDVAVQYVEQSLPHEEVESEECGTVAPEGNMEQPDEHQSTERLKVVSEVGISGENTGSRVQTDDTPTVCGNDENNISAFPALHSDSVHQYTEVSDDSSEEVITEVDLPSSCVIIQGTINPHNQSPTDGSALDTSYIEVVDSSMSDAERGISSLNTANYMQPSGKPHGDESQSSVSIDVHGLQDLSSRSLSRVRDVDAVLDAEGMLNPTGSCQQPENDDSSSTIGYIATELSHERWNENLASQYSPISSASSILNDTIQYGEDSLEESTKDVHDAPRMIQPEVFCIADRNSQLCPSDSGVARCSESAHQLVAHSGSRTTPDTQTYARGGDAEKVECSIPQLDDKCYEDEQPPRVNLEDSVQPFEEAGLQRNLSDEPCVQRPMTKQLNMMPETGSLTVAVSDEDLADEPDGQLMATCFISQFENTGDSTGQPVQHNAESDYSVADAHSQSGVKTAQSTESASTCDYVEEFSLDEDVSDDDGQDHPYEDESQITIDITQEEHDVHQGNSLHNSSESDGHNSDSSTYKDDDVILTGYTHLCKDCDEKFSDKDELQTHTLRVHNLPIHLQCKYCQEQFMSSSDLSTHSCSNIGRVVEGVTNEVTLSVDTNTTSVKPRCSICDKTFINTVGFKKHMHHMHGRRAANKETETVNDTNVSPSDKTVPVRTKYRCVVCKKLFGSSKGLKTHVHLQHNPTVASKYGQNAEAMINIQEANVMSSSDDCVPVGTKFRCEVCMKLLGSSRGLKIHIHYKHKPAHRSKNERHARKEDERAGMDTQEAENMSSNDNNNVTVGTKFCCDICRKLFGSLKGLQNHMHYKHSPTLSKNGPETKMKHTFQCDVCKNLLGSSRGLKNHLHYKHNPALRSGSSPRSEDNRKCVMCPTCGQRFLHVMGLKVHLHFRHKQSIRECFENANPYQALNPYVSVCALNIDASCGRVDIQDVKMMDVPCNIPGIARPRDMSDGITGPANYKYQLFSGVYIQEPRPSSSYEVNMTRAATTEICADEDKESTQKKCQLCPSAYANLKGLSRHVLSAHGIRYKIWRKYDNLFRKKFLSRRKNTGKLENKIYKLPFGCERCSKAFSSFSSLKRHQRSCQPVEEMKRSEQQHDGDPQEDKGKSSSSTAYDSMIECIACDCCFTSAAAFVTHFNEIHKPKDPSCTSSEQRSHGDEATNVGSSVCSQSSSVRIQQISGNIGSKPYACPVCDQSFPTVTSVNSHFESCHVNEAGTTNANRGKRSLDDKCCAKQPKRSKGGSAENTSEANGESRMAENKPYSCLVCSKKFSTMTSVESHYELSHIKNTNEAVGANEATKRVRSHRAESEKTTKRSRKEQVTCPMCGDKFQSVTDVEVHCEEVHFDSRRKSGRRIRIPVGGKFMCSMCDKAFCDSKSLDIHCQVHHSNKAQGVDNAKETSDSCDSEIGGQSEESSDDSKSLDIRCQVHHSNKAKGVDNAKETLDSCDSEIGGQSEESSDDSKSLDIRCQVHHSNKAKGVDNAKETADSCDSEIGGQSEESSDGGDNLRSATDSSESDVNKKQKKATNAIPITTKFKVMVDNLICLKCETQFEKMKYLEGHMRRNHKDTTLPYICGICGMGYLSTRSLEKHMHFKHEADEKTVCRKCNKSFPTKAKLHIHMTRKHRSHTTGMVKHGVFESKSPESVNKKKDGKVSTQPVQSRALKLTSKQKNMIAQRICPKCESTCTFSSMDSLERHFTRIHKELQMPHTCENCKKPFFTKSRLEKHNMRMHPTVESPKNQSRLSCQWCTLTFSSIHNLDRHAKQKHKEYECSYVCEICGKGFFTEMMLNKCRHQTSAEAGASPAEKYVSPVVLGPENSKSKSTMDDVTLNKSIELDNLEGYEEDAGDMTDDTVCPVCRYAYMSSKDMIKHFECDHPNVDKPFLCTLCHKGFLLEDAARNHFKRFHNIEVVCRLERNHNSKREAETNSVKSDLNCVKCSKHFQTSRDMITHFKSSHKQEWFACFIERKSTGMNSKDVEPYECKFCTRMFTESSSLEVHQLIEHTKSHDVSQRSEMSSLHVVTHSKSHPSSLNQTTQAKVNKPHSGKDARRSGAFSEELWKRIREPSPVNSSEASKGDTQSKPRLDGSTNSDDECAIVDISPPKTSAKRKAKPRKFHIVQVPVNMLNEPDQVLIRQNPERYIVKVSSLEHVKTNTPIASPTKTCPPFYPMASKEQSKKDTAKKYVSAGTSLLKKPVTAKLPRPPSNPVVSKEQSKKDTAESSVSTGTSLLKKPVTAKLPRPPSNPMVSKKQSKKDTAESSVYAGTSLLKKPVTAKLPRQTSSSSSNKSLTSQPSDHHNHFDHAVSLNICPCCRKHFSTLSELEKHFIKKHDVRKMRYRCSACNIGFLTHGGLSNHTAEVHKVQSMPHQCTICSKGFLTRPGLDHHMKNCHPSMGMNSRGSLPLAASGIFGRSNTSSAIRRDSEPGTSSREQSAKVVKTSVHESSRQYSTRPPQDGDDDDGGIFSCLNCDRTFLTIDGAESHARFTHGNSSMPFRCRNCKLGFLEQSRLDKHMSRFHSVP